MKFRIILTVLSLTTLLLTTACTSEESSVDIPDMTTTTAATTTLAPIVTDAPEGDTTAAIDDTTTTMDDKATFTTAAVEDIFLFTTDVTSPPFTLTMPASWEGKFTVRESETDVAFYELSNHHANAQGHLFTIKFLKDDPKDIGFPDYTLIGEYDDNYVIALFPTDVQYSEDLADAYNNLYNQRHEVLATFVYTG